MPDIPDMPIDDLVEKCKKLFSNAFGGPATIVVCAPGRVNPELEPTDDEIEAELNTMLGAPAAAAALADVKQEA